MGHAQRSGVFRKAIPTGRSFRRCRRSKWKIFCRFLGHRHYLKRMC